MIGLDTGFFIRLLENNKDAVQVWRKIIEGEASSVSCLSFLEIRRLSLREVIDDQTADVLIDGMLSVCQVGWIDGKEILLMGANLSHGLGMPTVDALILAGFLMLKVNTIYTTDSHFEMVKKKGVKIVKI